MVPAVEHNASSSTHVLHVVRQLMANLNVQCFFKVYQQDSNIAMQHQEIDPFGEGALPGEVHLQGAQGLITGNMDDSYNINNSEIYTLAHTPININSLKHELEYYDKCEGQIILNGFMHGFPLKYAGPRVPSESKNLKSASARPEITQQKIDKELAEGRIGGPFLYPPMPTLRISPLGLVEKKRSKDFRLIHHLSYPPNESVNDFIDSKLCYVKYASFDEAVSIVQELGQGCLLGKSDIKSAFRLIPVSPLDFDQLGFCFNGKYYFDKCLPFGCSISCATFERFSTFLEFVVRRRSTVGKMLHYLDDFLFGGSKGTNHCDIIMGHFDRCMTELGVPIADDKTEGPKTVICFLGIELDSDEMVVRIPMEKVNDISEKINTILQKEKVTVRSMQSLIGVLNFACRAIIPGRPFCRRLINSICGLSKPHYHLRVTKNIKKDLKMWLYFFKNFNGVSVFHDRYWISNAEAELYSDSAASSGFGVYFAGRWSNAPWPSNWVISGLTSDITVLELFPLVVALYIWGDDLRNKKILFHCDNSAVVYAINSMTSKSDNVMTLLRAFTLKCLQLNIVAKAKHIVGASNIVTDSLSRFQMDKFRRHAPQAQNDPDVIPNHLWKIFDLEPENF